MLLEVPLVLLALAAALAAQPWRLLAPRRPLASQAPKPSALWTPLLATLVLLPWLWALPTLHRMPLQLQWSGACLVLLMLGWPLAVPVLCAVGALAWALSPGLGAEAALLWGAGLRRWLGPHVFVYLFGRGFLGTVACGFTASMLAAAAGHPLPGVHTELSTIARWLMAWGDAVVTGMLSAIFVAYRPQWLATWSDDLYLYGKKP